ncbi:MAG TPA: hypothetical protein VIV36_01820 [Gaiella sp.]
MSAGPDVVARELVPLDPATLESVGRVAMTPPEELFGLDPIVVQQDNVERSRLDLGMTRNNDPAQKVLR